MAKHLRPGSEQVFVCEFCGYDGEPERGLMPRPSTKACLMCANCRGLIK